MSGFSLGDGVAAPVCVKASDLPKKTDTGWDPPFWAIGLGLIVLVALAAFRWEVVRGLLVIAAVVCPFGGLEIVYVSAKALRALSRRISMR